MAALWVIGSIIQLSTKRYFISHWKAVDVIHAVVGTIICVGTIWNCIYLYAECGINSWDIHVVLGTIAMVIDFVLLVSGFISYYIVNYYIDPHWEAPTKKVFWNKVHWYLGYFTIFLNLGVCFGGGLTYASKFLVDSPLPTYTIASGLTYLIVQVLSEMYYRRWRGMQAEQFVWKTHPKYKNEICPEEIYEMLKNGR